MSLYKRGNTWWVSFTTPSGQRIRCSARTEDKRLAQEFHDQQKAEHWRIHKLGEKPRRTWREAVVRWLADRKEKADLEKDVGKLKWLDPHLGDLYLDQIDRDRVDEIGQLKRDEASPSTANRYLALIRAILRVARDEWDWIDKMPRFRLYREPQKRVRFLTQSEAQRLLKELPPHLEAMAAFSLATGLRQRNVSYLRWDQVDIGRGLAWIYADQSKSKKDFAVPLNQDARSILVQQKGLNADYCFTYQGQPVDRTSTKAWKRALVRAGIKDFRWHDLRHTWASWHVQNGTSLHELMELGGWSSFEMVLRYAHFAGEHLKQAASHIDGTILSQGTNKKGLHLLQAL